MSFAQRQFPRRCLAQCRHGTVTYYRSGEIGVDNADTKEGKQYGKTRGAPEHGVTVVMDQYSQTAATAISAP
jgi:hypothetical protein